MPNATQSSSRVPARRAKIVCTLGPASRAPARVRALVEAGMDVARLNLSHGSPDEHRAACAAVREAARASGRNVAVLADLQGPKLRLGTFAGGEATLQVGAEFTLVPSEIQGTATRAGTSYSGIAGAVHAGDAVLIDDGRVKLQVLATDGGEVRTRVLEGGRVSDHKGISLPGVPLDLPALTEKDRRDIRFALGLGADWVALSFVRSPADADVVRTEMAAAGGNVPVMAKIERAEAVRQLEAVLDAFDGVMVARGDLGVEMPLEEVPHVQKCAVRLARERGKPVIVATQMLESMIQEPRPTRAEVSDVANAVLDGADALMLSAETSVGAHAVEAVETMARIVVTAEAEAPAWPALPSMGTLSWTDAIAQAAAATASELGACALVAFTLTGATARALARHRPSVPLLAFTTEEAVRRRIAVLWGVEGFVVPAAPDTDLMVAGVEEGLLSLGRGRPGEVVVIVFGAPPGVTGNTNAIRVHRLRER